MSIETYVRNIRSGVKYPTVDSRGYSIDLYSPSDYRIKKDAIINIDSGVSFNIPENHVGMLYPTASLALNLGFNTLAALIPHGYTDSITISLSQHSVEELYLSKNQHIAQLIIVPALKIND
jgi:dUTPase